MFAHRSDEDMAFLSDFPRCKYGAFLDDPNDQRFKNFTTLKERVQEMLHSAIVRLNSIDDKSDDAIDSIKMAIATSKHVMLNHPMDRSSYANVK